MEDHRGTFSLRFFNLSRFGCLNGRCGKWGSGHPGCAARPRPRAMESNAVGVSADQRCDSAPRGARAPLASWQGSGLPRSELKAHDLGLFAPKRALTPCKVQSIQPALAAISSAIPYQIEIPIAVIIALIKLGLIG